LIHYSAAPQAAVVPALALQANVLKNRVENHTICTSTMTVMVGLTPKCAPSVKRRENSIPGQTARGAIFYGLLHLSVPPKISDDGA
jgi:hypothetical protein